MPNSPRGGGRKKRPSVTLQETQTDSAVQTPAEGAAIAATSATNHHAAIATESSKLTESTIADELLVMDGSSPAHAVTHGESTKGGDCSGANRTLQGKIPIALLLFSSQETDISAVGRSRLVGRKPSNPHLDNILKRVKHLASSSLPNWLIMVADSIDTWASRMQDIRELQLREPDKYQVRLLVADIWFCGNKLSTTDARALLVEACNEFENDKPHPYLVSSLPEDPPSRDAYTSAGPLPDFVSLFDHGTSPWDELYSIFRNADEERGDASPTASSGPGTDPMHRWTATPGSTQNEPLIISGSCAAVEYINCEFLAPVYLRDLKVLVGGIRFERCKFHGGLFIRNTFCEGDIANWSLTASTAACPGCRIACSKITSFTARTTITAATRRSCAGGLQTHC
jgi:hypothetical protein